MESYKIWCCGLAFDLLLFSIPLPAVRLNGFMRSREGGA